MSISITEDVKKTYGDTLVELGEGNPKVVVLEADLMKASGSKAFMDRFPGRHFQVGIAEQNLVSAASGFAAMDKVPFACSFANFISQRSCDQVFMSAYNDFNVKLIGVYAGLSSAVNGGTHMSVEDIAIYRSMPRTRVIDPGDCMEFSQALKEACRVRGMVYIRISRGPMPFIFPEDYRFEIGKSVVLEEGFDISIITTGIATAQGIKACKELKSKGLGARLIHMPTIKPIDRDEVLRAARDTGIIVTVENHSRIGGLGSAVAEVTGRDYPVKVESLGLNDMFGETGKLEWLMDRFEISSKHIVQTVENLIKE